MQVHPCGNLPITGHHISLWYCHFHMAWFAHFSHVEQRAEEPMEHSAKDLEFGPFDTPDEVIAEALLWLTTTLAATR